MYFEPLLASDEQRAEYRRQLASFAGFLGDYNRFLVRVVDAAHAAMADGRGFHTTVLMLARHVVSSLDGVAVLVAQGCAEASAPLLRSAFEGTLGVGYILKDDHDRRGLAYQVAHVHRKLKLYRRADATDQLGKGLRAELAGQSYAHVLSHVPFDLKGRVARLEGVLREPQFVPVEEAWVARKAGTDGRPKDSDPSWYSLFGGPRGVSGLARELGQLTLYWLLYKKWSDVVHAGSGMDNVTVNAAGEHLIRPIRHPGELQTVVGIAAEFGMRFADRLLTFYRQDSCGPFWADYGAELHPRYEQLCATPVPFPSWH